MTLSLAPRPPADAAHVDQLVAAPRFSLRRDAPMSRRMAGHTVAAWENLVALVWKDLPTVAGVRELASVFDRVVAEQARLIGFATRINPALSPDKSPAEVRTGVGDLLRRHGPRIGATVIIYEAHGLRATITRTIISAINVLGGVRFPSQVHGNTLQGVLWLTRQLGGAAPADAETRLLSMLGL